MFSTDPAIRDQFITGLRQLADYLATHPDVPVPPYGRTISVNADHYEDGGKTQVDTVAGILGVPVEDDTADNGHYHATRDFGPVSYRVVAIPQDCCQLQPAQFTHQGHVSPDTWTASA